MVNHNDFIAFLKDLVIVITYEKDFKSLLGSWAIDTNLSKNPMKIKDIKVSGPIYTQINSDISILFYVTYENFSAASIWKYVINEDSAINYMNKYNSLTKNILNAFKTDSKIIPDSKIIQLFYSKKT